MISVTNNSSSVIEVAINKWGSSGDTNYYSLSPQNEETWDRVDDKGFVMSVKQNGAVLPYYVLPNSHIVFQDINPKVTDGGKAINPINR